MAIRRKRSARKTDPRPGSKTLRLPETLASLRTGDRAIVVAVKSGNAEHFRTLMALAVLPGTSLKCVQHFPVPVFQSGHFQFAIDRILGGQVIIRRC